MPTTAGLQRLVAFLRARREQKYAIEKRFVLTNQTTGEQRVRIYCGPLLLDEDDPASKPDLNADENATDLVITCSYPHDTDGDNRDDFDMGDLWSVLRVQRGDVVRVNQCGVGLFGEVDNIASLDKHEVPANPAQSSQTVRVRIFREGRSNEYLPTQKTTHAVLVRLCSHEWLTLCLEYASSKSEAAKYLALPIWTDGSLDRAKAAHYNESQKEALGMFIGTRFRSDIAKHMSVALAPLESLPTIETGADAVQTRLEDVRKRVWGAFQQENFEAGGGGLDDDDSDEEDEAVPSNSALIASNVDNTSVIGWNTVDFRWPASKRTHATKHLRNIRNASTVREITGDSTHDRTWADFKRYSKQPHSATSDAMGALIKSRVFQAVEMLTISSVIGTRVHQRLCNDAIFASARPTATTDTTVSYPATRVFQMLYAKVGGQVVLPTALERYWRTEDGTGLSMLDGVAATLATAVSSALAREGITIVGTEIPVIDPYRLFKNRRKRCQVMETRIDALGMDAEGNLLLIEYKSRIGNTTQVSFTGIHCLPKHFLNSLLTPMYARS